MPHHHQPLKNVFPGFLDHVLAPSTYLRSGATGFVHVVDMLTDSVVTYA